jgi:hypothetical protein
MLKFTTIKKSLNTMNNFKCTAPQLNLKWSFAILPSMLLVLLPPLKFAQLPCLYYSLTAEHNVYAVTFNSKTQSF